MSFPHDPVIERKRRDDYAGLPLGPSAKPSQRQQEEVVPFVNRAQDGYKPRPFSDSPWSHRLPYTTSASEIPSPLTSSLSQPPAWIEIITVTKPDAQIVHSNELSAFDCVFDCKWAGCEPSFYCWNLNDPSQWFKANSNRIASIARFGWDNDRLLKEFASGVVIWRELSFACICYRMFSGKLLFEQDFPIIRVMGINDGDGRGRDGGGAFCGVGHNVYIT